MDACRTWYGRSHHLWGRWVEIERGAIERGEGDRKREIGNYLTMERECNLCGIKELTKSTARITKN